MSWSRPFAMPLIAAIVCALLPGCGSDGSTAGPIAAGRQDSSHAGTGAGKPDAVSGGNPASAGGGGAPATGSGSAGREGGRAPIDAARAGRAGTGAPAADGGSRAGAGDIGAPSAGKGSGGGEADSSGAGASAAGNAGAGGSSAPVPTEKFSFFVTSVAAMRELSKSEDGFGGDLRFGKATGLEGADEICRQVAEKALPGSGQKGWRAFLSTTAGGPNGGPVHAKDRVGEGPWYDRLGRLVAMTKTDLLQPRPRGADPAIIDDLPNENGIPNHLDGAPGCTGNECPDNHQVLTGTNAMGMLYRNDMASTCNDWTNSMPTGRPWCGHSWPREVSGVNWMSAVPDGGCAPCVEIVEMGGPRAPCVGSSGGYGAIYCFALMP